MLKTCVDVFMDAQQRRLSFPLPSGAYKIHEGIRSLQAIGATVKTIQDKIINGKPFRQNEHLGCCLGYERGSYLKSVPKRISWYLGYDILPGIAALHGNGWDSNQVRSAHEQADNSASSLIARCDNYQRLIKPSIKVEYDAMQTGDSVLLDLILRAIFIGERALKFCDNEAA